MSSVVPQVQRFSIHMYYFAKWVVKTLRHEVDFCFEMKLLSFEDWYRLKHMLRVPSGSKDFVVVDSVVLPKRGLVSIVYRLLAFSGYRLEEAAKVINEFDERRLVCLDGFCRYGLFWRRGFKRCDYVYAPASLWLEVRSLKRLVSTKSISAYARKRGLTRPKTLRKFFY